MNTFIDLFCGIGGFRLALEKAGLTGVFSSDIDLEVQEAYERNFGERPVGDLRAVPAAEIPAHDVLCAGFPCQAFTASGKRQGFADERGQLFFEIVRIAGYCQPKVLLLENVRNIMVIDEGRTLQTIKDELAAIGYQVHVYVLNASQYGVPQARVRVYFVGIRNDLTDRIVSVKPEPAHCSIRLQDVLEESVDERLQYSGASEMTYSSELPESAPKLIRVGHIGNGGQGRQIYSPQGHAATLLASANSGWYLVNDKVRRLSVTECKRIMGFPNSHIVSAGRAGFKQLGNAIVPEMVSAVLSQIKGLDD